MGRASEDHEGQAFVQPSGKKRIIDDAAVGGQLDLSSDANKLVLCNALRPAQCATASPARSCCSQLDVPGSQRCRLTTMRAEVRTGRMPLATAPSPERRAIWLRGYMVAP